MSDNKRPFKHFVEDIVRHGSVCGCRNLVFTDPPSGGDHAAISVVCGDNPGIVVAAVTVAWDHESKEVVLV